MTIKKPMLAADLADLARPDGSIDFSSLRWPLAGSPKLDGVRAIIPPEGMIYTRKGKLLRNRYTQGLFANVAGIDGELIVGSAIQGEVLGRTYSGVMSFDGEPDVRLYAFDSIGDEFEGVEFVERWRELVHAEDNHDRIVRVPHRLLRNEDELLDFESRCLARGYEGIMLRDPHGPYKNGRSTLREGWLMKLKRFTDGEAIVTGLEEGSVNGNTLERDELGMAKRSKAKAGLTPSGMVGTILVDDPKWGPLRIAPGKMDHAMRAKLLRKPSLIIGKTIHWRSFGYGLKDAPRHARFYGIREDI